MGKKKCQIKVRFIDEPSESDIDDEIISFVEENVCIPCRKVARAKKDDEYFKLTKCKEGSICGAASMLQAMIRYECFNHNSNNIVRLIMKIIELDNQDE